MADTYLQEQISQSPELSETYSELLSLYENKQWHQLTHKLSALVSDRKGWNNENMVDLYRNFVAEFKARLNPVSVVEFGVTAANQLYPSRPYNADELAKAKAFLGEILSFLNEGTSKNTLLGASAALCDNARFLCESEILLFDILGEADAFGQQTLLQQLNERQKTLEDLRSPEPVVQGSYYKCAAELHRAMGSHGKFYKTGLMYLVFTPSDNIARGSGMEWATDLSLAALLGDGIYNFGEILTNSVLTCLQGTDKEWLRKMLEVFNNGDIDGFLRLLKSEKSTIAAQRPDFMDKVPELTKKLELLALTDLIFRRPANERIISFSDIAAKTKKNLDEVEMLVMRAMSVGLIKGVVDGVDRVLEATWVEPRVLDAPQINSLCGRLGDWGDKVHETLIFIENQTPELFQG